LSVKDGSIMASDKLYTQFSQTHLKRTLADAMSSFKSLITSNHADFLCVDGHHWWRAWPL